VSGRSDTGYGERIELDTAYVNGWTLAKDVKILFQTINVVLRQKGAV